MIGNTSSTSFHFAVDDKEVRQGIPTDRNAWHTGDGKNGTGNRSLSVWKSATASQEDLNTGLLKSWPSSLWLSFLKNADEVLIVCGSTKIGAASIARTVF